MEACEQKKHYIGALTMVVWIFSVKIQFHDSSQNFPEKRRRQEIFLIAGFCA
jgi:hypothetical protein